MNTANLFQAATIKHVAPSKNWLRKVTAGLVLGAGLLGATHASVVTPYSDRSTFEAFLGQSPNVLLGRELFPSASYQGPLSNGVSGADGGVSWQASASGGLYADVGLMSTNNALTPLVFNFSGTPIRAIGGNFFATDFDFGTIPANLSISITFVGGGDETFSPLLASGSSAFFGFVSSGPAIARLSITPVADNPPGSTDYFAIADNLVFGNVPPSEGAVPEPLALALFGLGLALMAGLQRRRPGLPSLKGLAPSQA